jgi:hypothetical protein
VVVGAVVVGAAVVGAAVVGVGATVLAAAGAVVAAALVAEDPARASGELPQAVTASTAAKAMAAVVHRVLMVGRAGRMVTWSLYPILVRPRQIVWLGHLASTDNCDYPDLRSFRSPASPRSYGGYMMAP